MPLYKNSNVTFGVIFKHCVGTLSQIEGLSFTCRKAFFPAMAAFPVTKERTGIFCGGAPTAASPTPLLLDRLNEREQDNP